MGAAVQNLTKEVMHGQLSQLLRQATLLAAKLNLEPVEWIDLELQGLSEDAEPPAYRKVFTQRLEIYDALRDVWQSAGRLNYALKLRQPLAEIEGFSQREFIEFPVTKNFSIKNDFGDSFGSDWPQRFVVPGSEFQQVLGAVAQRWSAELELRGIRIVDAEKFGAFMEALSVSV
jgi:hypothetical protein